MPLTVTLHSDTPSAQYDANSALTHLTATGPSGVSNPLDSRYDYAYNAAAWTTAMTATVNGVVTATQITHNALGRITRWTGQIHGPETWAYDGNGNIISNTEFISDAIRTTTFTYSQTTPNQLDQQQTQGLGVEYFTYDQHGDTTSLTSTDPATYPNGQLDPYHVNIHVGYDAQERPLTVTTLMNGAPITATLAYNAEGLRSRYTVISGTTTLRDEHFQYRNGLLGQDVVLSGTQTYTDTFVYNQAGLPLELIRQQGGTTNRYWYVLDGRNNVVALVDANGNVVDRYAYDLWGEGLPEGTVETVRQPLRYGGYWWDQEVGWYWVTTRYYDPEGRWLQPDPSEQDGVHTYVYAGDDPVDASDPSGLNTYLIWASAFIAPASIPFPYWSKACSTVGPVCIPRTVQLGQFNGNNRGFWNGKTPLPTNPHSEYSKQANLVVIDTSKVNPLVVDQVFEGPSRVTYPVDRCPVIMICRVRMVTDRGQASLPRPAKVFRLGRSIEVDIDMETSLPLIGFSPPIISRYKLLFDPLAGKLYVTGSHTPFPWQELYVTGVGSIEHYDPTAHEPFANPGYLMLGPTVPVNRTVPLPSDPFALPI